MNYRGSIAFTFALAGLACAPGAEDSARPEATPGDLRPDPQNPATAPETTDPETPSEPTDPLSENDQLRTQLLASLPSPQLPAPLPSYGNDPRPAHAQTPRVNSYDNTPADNPITSAGATLGRVLFYDRLLSHNGTVSCASCHIQEFAFSDPRPLSVGFDGGRTGRNSMGLMNVGHYARGSMFWDERAATLEDQVLMPIQDPVEMGLTLEELELRVSSASYYPELFQAAFGRPEITSERIALALAQFVRSIRSFGSRWDEGVAQADSIAEDFVNFTPQENLGKRIFFGQNDPATGGACGTCHLRDNPLARNSSTNTAIFYVDRPRNIGLPRNDDNGFGETTGQPQDSRAFKASSLRNVALTAPYMHDGRFANLEAVVRFYSGGITDDPNLDPQLRGPNGQPIRFRLNPQAQAALVAFLRTLTDLEVTQDSRFSDPFPTAP